MGVRAVEKHFTDDNSRSGPDHPFSMNPKTWRDMVDRTRELEASLGDGKKRIEENERKSAIVQRRALRATRDLAAGVTLTAADLEPLRPCPEDGIQPYRIQELLGKTVVKPVASGLHITWEHLRL
jgi:N-acetylneuraminate synthase